MNERSAGFFLLLLLNINIIIAQIQFPDENYESLISDLTPVRVDRAPSIQQNRQITPNQNNYPSQQSYPNYPFPIPQNYPLPILPNYPIPIPQNYPQNNQDNFRIQQNQQNYPTQQNQNYPSEQNRQNSAPQQTRPNSAPQQTRPNSAPQQNRPNSASQQNHLNSSPQQNRQNSSPQQNRQNSASQQSLQNSSPQQSRQNSNPQQIRQISTPRPNRQKTPNQSTQQNSAQQSRQFSPQPNRQSQRNPTQQSTNQNSRQNSVAKVVSNGFTKLILDLNRVAPITSPHLAQADNVVYGPVTIAGALAMVMLASIGATFDEIVNFLGLSSGLGVEDDPLYVHEQIAKLFANMETTTGLEIGQRVNFATAIFIQQDYPIRPAYQKAAELLYHSDIMNLDFKGNPQMAMDVINTWVSGRTNGKIPNLIAEAPPSNTKTVIASVMYFQAAWQFPFFDGGTQWRPFYINGRKKPSDRMALMMTNGGEFPYHRDANLGVEIMGFPYKGKATTMYVIMPFESNKEKLKKLENSLTPADIDHLVNSSSYTEAVVLFPKMKLESTINLRPALQRLGVNTMFSQYDANMALLSEGISRRYNGEEAPFVSAPINAGSGFRRDSQIPAVSEDITKRLIFNRFSDDSNCIPVFDPITNVSSKCEEHTPNGNPIPLATRAGSSIPVLDTLSNIREQLIQNPGAANPGLYADQVIHKVYIDITESGTEAAAATGISLNRSGDRVTFRVDTPFLFFIYHEETKVILFWGSVKSPTPTVARST